MAPPAKDYNTLLKQFKAMECLIKSMEAASIIQSEKIKQLEHELKVCKNTKSGSEAEALRELVERLTNELEERYEH